MSDPQETNYYSHHYDRGYEWYLSCFDAQGVKLDVSPTYFRNASLAAPRAASVLNGLDARFSLVLRNPLDYIESLYSLDIRRGHSPRQGILSRPPPLGEVTHAYLSAARYAECLVHWYSSFNPSQFKVLLFERFSENPLVSLRAIAEFFGLDPALLSEPDIIARNATPRRYAVDNGLRATARALRLNRAHKGLPVLAEIHRFLVGKPKPLLQQRERQALAEALKPDVAQLRGLLGDPLPEWWELS